MYSINIDTTKRNYVIIVEIIQCHLSCHACERHKARLDIDFYFTKKFVPTHIARVPSTCYYLTFLYTNNECFTEAY
jgi:hypothetical protein